MRRKVRIARWGEMEKKKKRGGGEGNEPLGFAKIILFVLLWITYVDY